MIALACLEYEGTRELDWKITQYVNKNLEEIIHFAWDNITESGDIEYYSPPRLVLQSRNECILRIKELWSFSQDYVLHKELSPVYQYHLYRIIERYIECLSELEAEPNQLDEELIIHEMDAGLREQVKAQYGEETISFYTNIKFYPEVLFDDWDFMPEFLANVVQLYLDESPLLYALISIEELDEYTELMDGDTYRKYQAKRTRNNTENKQKEDNYLEFEKDLKKALLFIQANPQYWDYDENRINDKLRDLLRMKYDVYDQTRQGVSLSKKSVGEIDFLVSAGAQPIAIMEALKLDSVDKSYIKDHIEKLLVNYDPLGYPRACLIMYVICKDFGLFWNKFTEYISEYAFPYPVDEGFREGNSDFSESKNAYMVLLRNSRPTLLSFHAIHLKENVT